MDHSVLPVRDVVRSPWTDESAEVRAGKGGALLKDPLQVVRESD